MTKPPKKSNHGKVPFRGVSHLLSGSHASSRFYIEGLDVLYPKGKWVIGEYGDKRYEATVCGRTSQFLDISCWHKFCLSFFSKSTINGVLCGGRYSAKMIPEILWEAAKERKKVNMLLRRIRNADNKRSQR